MSNEEQRKMVSEMYPGKRWRRRVRRMHDNQVYAIWVKEMKRLEDEAKKPKPDQPDKNDDIPF